MNIIHVNENEAVTQLSKHVTSHLDSTPKLSKFRKKWHIPPRGIKDDSEQTEHEDFLRGLSIRVKRGSIKQQSKPSALTDLTAAYSLLIKDIKELVKQYNFPSGWFKFFQAYAVYGPSRISVNTSKMFLGQGWDEKQNKHFVSIRISPFLRDRDIKEIWGNKVSYYCEVPLPKISGKIEKPYEVIKMTDNETGEPVLIIKLFDYIPVSEAVELYRKEVHPLQKSLPGFKNYLRPSKEKNFKRDIYVLSPNCDSLNYDETDPDLILTQQEEHLIRYRHLKRIGIKNP